MVPNNDEVLYITQNVLNTMVNMGAELDENKTELGEGNRLTGCVQISGAWQGAVIVQASKGFITEAATHMLQIGHDEVTPVDLEDVLAEITNMIGGSIKSQVPGPSYLSIPSVTTGQDFRFNLKGASVLGETRMKSSNEPLQVIMCESDA